MLRIEAVGGNEIDVREIKENGEAVVGSARERRGERAEEDIDGVVVTLWKVSAEGFGDVSSAIENFELIQAVEGVGDEGFGFEFRMRDRKVARELLDGGMIEKDAESQALGDGRRSGWELREVLHLIALKIA